MRIEPNGKITWADSSIYNYATFGSHDVGFQFDKQEAPEAANAELKARVHDARIIFEGLQAEQRKEMHWLAQYYGEENEETLKKLGIRSKKEIGRAHV